MSVTWHVAIAQLMSVTVLSLQTRHCFLSVTSLSLHWTRTRVSVPLLSLQCAIVTWQTLCNDSNSSAQVSDGNSEIGHIRFSDYIAIVFVFTVYCVLGTSLLWIYVPIYSYYCPYKHYLLPMCFKCLYILPLYILCIYSFMYWKSGTSDLLVLMLFVLQCTDYK